MLIYGLRYIWRAMLYGAAINIVRKQRDQLFTHLTRMSPDFYQRYSTGDLMAHATNDLNAVEDCAGGGIMTLIDSAIAGITVLAAMIFVVNGQLDAYGAAAFSTADLEATGRYGTTMHSRFGSAQASFSALNEEARRPFPASAQYRRTS